MDATEIYNDLMDLRDWIMEAKEWMARNDGKLVLAIDANVIDDHLVKILGKIES